MEQQLSQPESNPESNADESLGKSHTQEKQHPLPVKRRGRVVSLTVLLGIVTLLTIVAIALGVGLGVGLPRHTETLIIYKNTTSNFNYSSFYGIPDVLPLANSTTLVNHAELDLQTAFVKSNVTTVREYTLNITQNLAAPDGLKLKI